MIEDEYKCAHAAHVPVDGDDDSDPESSALPTGRALPLVLYALLAIGVINALDNAGLLRGCGPSADSSQETP